MVDRVVAQRSPLQVLIADDCPVTRRLLLHFLKKHGHEVTVTENGLDCMKTALADSYDVIISDIDMPEMSGIECAAHLRQAGLDLPIIAITATAPDVVREDCFKAGMNAFLTKPLNFSELKEQLDMVSSKNHEHHPVS